ncbi:MAG: flagellar assembly protein FliW [Clostridiales bacterium]|nr:flagellar assembly protein FliW [Clostridiales bacterium]
MKINTKYFGEMDVADNQKINFPEPLAGFENLSSYIIVQFYDDSDSLLCLQSLENPDLAFVLVNPHYVTENYTPVLTAEDMNTLRAEADTPLAYYVIAVVNEDWKNSTVNLKCPITVNPEKMLGKQVIMEDTAYSMRHPVDRSVKREV